MPHSNSKGTFNAKMVLNQSCRGSELWGGILGWFFKSDGSGAQASATFTAVSFGSATKPAIYPAYCARSDPLYRFTTEDDGSLKEWRCDNS